MGVSKKWVAIFIIIIILVGGFNYILYTANDFKQSGELSVKGLTESVRTVRDEKGMAYIFANNMEDAILSQGFVTAQDRLFSMELVKMIVKGQLTEVFGETAKSSDIKMRTIGFYRNAKKHVTRLDEQELALFQKYVDGVNAFVETRSDEVHLKLKLAGIKPQKWEVADAISIIYYMGWGSAANLEDEIIAQLLVERLGPEKAKEIFPLNINPEDPGGKPIRNFFDSLQTLDLAANDLMSLQPLVEEHRLAVGSNNWVANGELSAGGKPILANDPHLDTRVIPGPFYPCGIITPEFRAVGVNVPGIPGMVIGRTDSIATGVTNGYGDIQDLYIETLDPENSDHYLEGKSSIPFQLIEETLTIKDKNAPDGFRQEKITIRLTKRGPIISNIYKDLKSPKLFSLRWSPFESMGPKMGFFSLLTARDIYEARNGLKGINAIMLNFVLADTKGNIAWQTSGKIPLRTQKDGTVPYVVRDSTDNWKGWIDWEEMPHSINPGKGWVGTCNHTTVTGDYPYYFSSHFSPSWRQSRLNQLFASSGQKTVNDHWSFQRDTKNLMAERIAPIMARVLSFDLRTQDLAGILSQWNYHDDPGLVAPSVFQTLFREIVLLTYQDELGDELAMSMAKNIYFWQERLVGMMEKGSSHWFDDVNTLGKVESMTDIVLEAGLIANKKLSQRYGEDKSAWTWGKLHQKEYVSAIRRSGIGKGLLGGGSYPMPGSPETLHRGYYNFDQPFKTTVTASLRMVVDFSDPDKILAVMPSGVSDRFLNSHRTDQIKSFMDGGKLYWWFSDEEINKHAKSELIFSP